MTGEPGHILIVDDNRMNRLTLTHGVQQLGHTVCAAESGAQALEIVRQEPVDAVLLDIIMPEMDGFEVLSRLKNDPNLRDIPVIIISALDELDSAARAIELGAEDYLAKPFNSILLRARLNASLEKKRYRDLERAYLEQEMTLRQSERLATLGKLSAGMAHELNNPIAAALRGAGQLEPVLDELTKANREISISGISTEKINMLADLCNLARQRDETTPPLDPLAQSEREQVVERMLTDAGVDDAWKYASALASSGFTTDQLQPLVDGLSSGLASSAITQLSMTCSLHDTIDAIHTSLDRISHIVAALKSYSFMDQAPVQLVNIHEGLDNTLVILRSAMSDGVVVVKEYDPAVPRVEGFGSELNQVWTNILENALGALHGSGRIAIRTRLDSPWAIVEIEDSGPGIPPEVQAKVFDPFFSTKPPGLGAGLGLTISHNIIVQKHHGQITLQSQPGSTCFQVRLPLDGRAGDAGSLS